MERNLLRTHGDQVQTCGGQLLQAVASHSQLACADWVKLRATAQHWDVGHGLLHEAGLCLLTVRTVDAELLALLALCQHMTPLHKVHCKLANYVS